MGRVKFRAFSGSCGVLCAALSILVAISLLSPSYALAQTEMGIEHDFSVYGVGGTAADPNVEIKGFTVFGSTQEAYTGATAGPGNVVVNGVLSVSSGAYFVGNSTFTGAGNIFINDGATGQLLRRNAAGHLEWTDGTALGDNLGNHVATTTLNMASFSIVDVSSINFLSNVYLTSATAAQRGGVYVSTHLFVAGISSATSYYGDGSTLTGVSTDTLKIGDAYGGGIVFWVDSENRNALVSATADQSADIVWAPTTGFTGAQANGVGAGKANTVMVTTTTGPGSYAARLCADYTATVGGVYYDDWYLPSIYELQLLYVQRTVVGGISANWYWSSTEYVPDTTDAWVVDFNSGGVGNGGGKTTTNYVRCVRGGPVSGFDHLRDAETVRNGAYVNATQTFSGENTFTQGVTASSFTATGIGVRAAQLRLAAAPGVVISSEASAALGGGVRVSTNVYIVGFSSAAKYYGDGSALTGLGAMGDNLGSHVATTTLDMSMFNIVNVASITAQAPFTLYSSFTATGGASFAGNIGIGTNSPAAALHIKKTGNAILDIESTTSNDAFIRFNTGSWWIAGIDDSDGESFRISQQSSYTGNKDHLTIRTDGATGVRTTDPQAALDVKSTGTASDIYAQIWRDGDGVIVGSMSATGVMMATRFVGDVSGASGLPSGDNLGNHTATNRLNMANKAVDSVSSMTITGTGVTGSNPLFKVAGSTMVVLNNGNVGVGTASPASLLHVYGANPAVTVRGSGSNSAEINLQGNDGDWHLENQYVNGPETNLFRIYNSALSANAVTILRNSNNVGIGTATPVGLLHVGAGATAGLLVTSAGNVGIGTTAPDYKLDVQGGNTRIQGQQYLQGSSARIGVWLGNPADNVLQVQRGNDSFNLMYIAASGNVGISTGAPQARLDVLSAGSTQTDMAQIWRKSDGVIVGSMSATGVMMATKFVGDVSGASGLPSGDNLGNHTATQVLQLGAYGVNSSSSITAARYQINGSTVLAILPGVESIAVGPNIGGSNTGNYNVFVGSGAAAVNTTGAQDTFLGHSAGYSNTTGAQNTFVGYASGYKNLGGWYNTFLGVNAGYNNNSGQYNTFLGNGAGLANTTGSNNAYLGYYAGSNGQTGGGNIVIGYNQGLSASAANNELNLGGVLYGDLAAKTIGISTRVPQAALDIVSTGTAHTDMATIWRDSDGTIVSSLSATGVMMAAKFVGDGAGLTGVPASMPADISVSTINATAAAPYGGVNVTTNVFVQGNVGVGTLAPTAKFQVQGYEAGQYTVQVSTSSTAGNYSIAVTSEGITNINSLVIENRTSDPVAPVTGQIWLIVD